MLSRNYVLPRDNDVEKGTLPAGNYKVTLSGMSAATLTVEGWNGSAWVSLGTKSKANSGKIGFLSITVPASGRIRCRTSAVVQPASCKVRIDK